MSRAILCPMMHRHRIRYWPCLLLLPLVLLALLAGCRGRAQDLPSGPSIAIEELPDGIGRGYAQVQVDAAPRTGAPTVGAPAPDFRLLLDDGRTLTLHSLNGRPVLINHWATWCAPCRNEMPLLRQAAQEHPDLVVLAANLQQARSQIEPFAAEFALDLPVVLDAQGALRDLYGVRGLPTTYVIDRDGQIAGVHHGELTADDLAALLARVL